MLSLRLTNLTTIETIYSVDIVRLICLGFNNKDLIARLHTDNEGIIDEVNAIRNSLKLYKIEKHVLKYYLRDSKILILKKDKDNESICESSMCRNTTAYY